MKKHKIIAAAVLAAGIGAAGASAAIAANDDSSSDASEFQALMAARLTVLDAVKAAETTQPGKVSEVQFDLEKGAPSFEVSIVSPDGTEHGFTVDANTGKVERVAADEDHGNENGEHEEGESQ